MSHVDSDPRRWLRRALAAVLLALTLPSSASALVLKSRTHLSPRLSELRFRTPSLAEETHVRVLLPKRYAQSRQRYPVIYLLHGGFDDYRSWTNKGAAEAITAGAPVIVVMPDSGEGKGYVDWFNGGAFGPPAWETYHLRELVPWVDRNYRTRARRAGRATVGLSMGGYGAFEYAAREPDMFVAAAGFSPAVDIADPFLLALNQAGEVDGSGAYGHFATNSIYTYGRNPTTLAENLAGLKLTLRTGNGLPGGEGGDPGDPIELAVHRQAVTMHERLVELDYPHLFEDYGAGGHTWFYWQRDLRKTLPDLLKVFADPPAPPSPFTYRSIDPDFSVYGWRVHIERPAREFAVLRDADRRGFELLGSGSAVVRTGRLFGRGERVRAVVRAEGASTVRLRLRAGRRGRVTVPVTLGPGNPQQEGAPGATTAVYEVRVTLR